MIREGTKSRLLVAKQKRKEASHDALLLKNRLALLKAEEQKAWKKIEHTKERAHELLRLREESDRKAAAKREQLEKQKRIRTSNKKAKDTNNNRFLTGSKDFDINSKLKQKREEAQNLKEEKQKWRKQVEASRRQDLAKAVKRKECVLKHEEHLKSMKLKKQANLERLAKERAENRILEEEEVLKKKQAEVQKMEKQEMELIRRLRKTQTLQKVAYDELEHALGTANIS